MTLNQSKLLTQDVKIIRKMKNLKLLFKVQHKEGENIHCK